MNTGFPHASLVIWFTTSSFPRFFFHWMWFLPSRRKIRFWKKWLMPIHHLLSFFFLFLNNPHPISFYLLLLFLYLAFLLLKGETQHTLDSVQIKCWSCHASLGFRKACLVSNRNDFFLPLQFYHPFCAKIEIKTVLSFLCIKKSRLPA